MAEINTLSKQPRTVTSKDQATSFIWTFLESANDGIPGWGRPGRTEKLREISRGEPILAGAVASMVSKTVSLDWQIVGPAGSVSEWHDLLAQSEDGQGWSYFLDRWVHDYLVTDIGGVAELGRIGKSGPVGGLYNLDAACLSLTGNTRIPLRYTPARGGESIAFKPGDFMRIVDLPSTNEKRDGLGFCACSRALKAAKILMSLYQYEDEQLADLPPQGIVTVTGMSMPEVIDAFKLYEAKRNSNEQLTFKGVLWLAAQMSGLNPIDVKITPFSTLPAHFDKNAAISTYVATLALAFGTDVREFWPFSQGPLGTAREAEVQAQKAKGKGFGRMLMSVERAINWEVLPEGFEFSFDNRDSEDDLLREEIRARTINNVRRLWEPGVDGVGIITTEEARQMLVEAETIPERFATVPTSITDGRIQETGKSLSRYLHPGEDLISINSKGDRKTVFTNRTYSIPGWSVPEHSPFVPTYP